MSGSAGRRVFLRVRGAHNVKAISRKVVWSSGGMTSTTGRRSTKPVRSVPFHMGSEKVTEWPFLIVKRAAGPVAAGRFACGSRQGPFRGNRAIAGRR